MTIEHERRASGGANAPRGIDDGLAPWLRHPAVVCAALFLGTLLLFGRAVSFEFVNVDDTDYVVGNPNVQHGVSRATLAWALTGVHSANWHPLTWVSHMIDYDLFGVAPARASRGERAVARAERSARLSRAATLDGLALDQCRVRGAVRLAPAARRVGGVGVGAQGRPGRVLLPADAVGVGRLRRAPRGRVRTCRAGSGTGSRCWRSRSGC